MVVAPLNQAWLKMSNYIDIALLTSEVEWNNILRKSTSIVKKERIKSSPNTYIDPPKSAINSFNRACKTLQVVGTYLSLSESYDEQDTEYQQTIHYLRLKWFTSTNIKIDTPFPRLLSLIQNVYIALCKFEEYTMIRVQMQQFVEHLLSFYYFLFLLIHPWLDQYDMQTFIERTWALYGDESPNVLNQFQIRFQNGYYLFSLDIINRFIFFPINEPTYQECIQQAKEKDLFRTVKTKKQVISNFPNTAPPYNLFGLLFSLLSLDVPYSSDERNSSNNFVNGISEAEVNTQLWVIIVKIFDSIFKTIDYNDEPFMTVIIHKHGLLTHLRHHLFRLSLKNEFHKTLTEEHDSNYTLKSKFHRLRTEYNKSYEVFVRENELEDKTIGTKYYHQHHELTTMRYTSTHTVLALCFQLYYRFSDLFRHEFIERDWSEIDSKMHQIRSDIQFDEIMAQLEPNDPKKDTIGSDKDSDSDDDKPGIVIEDDKTPQTDTFDYPGLPDESNQVCKSATPAAPPPPLIHFTENKPKDLPVVEPKKDDVVDDGEMDPELAALLKSLDEPKKEEQDEEMDPELAALLKSLDEPTNNESTTKDVDAELDALLKSLDDIPISKPAPKKKNDSLNPNTILSVDHWGNEDEMTLDQKVEFGVYAETRTFYHNMYIRDSLWLIRMILINFKINGEQFGPHDMMVSNTIRLSTNHTSVPSAIDAFLGRLVKPGGFVANNVLFSLLFDETKSAGDTFEYWYWNCDQMLMATDDDGTQFPITKEYQDFIDFNRYQYSSYATTKEPQDPHGEEQANDIKTQLNTTVVFEHNLIDLLIQHHTQYDYISTTRTNFRIKGHPRLCATPFPFYNIIGSILYANLSPIELAMEKKYLSFVKYTFEQHWYTIIEDTQLIQSPHKLLQAHLDKTNPSYEHLLEATDITSFYNQIDSSVEIFQLFRNVFTPIWTTTREPADTYYFTMPYTNQTIGSQIIGTIVDTHKLPYQCKLLSTIQQTWHRKNSQFDTIYGAASMRQPKRYPHLPFPLLSHAPVSIVNKTHLQNVYDVQFMMINTWLYHTNLPNIMIQLIQHKYWITSLFLMKQRYVKEMVSIAQETNTKFDDDKFTAFRTEDYFIEAETPKEYNYLHYLSLIYENNGIVQDPHARSEQWVQFENGGVLDPNYAQHSYESLYMRQQGSKWIEERNHIDISTELASYQDHFRIFREYVIYIATMQQSKLLTERTGKIEQDKGFPTLTLDSLQISFLTTMNHFNFIRTIIYRSLQVGPFWSQRRDVDNDITTIYVLDHIYRQMKLFYQSQITQIESPLIEFKPVTNADTIYTAIIFQHVELLLASIQGFSNVAFAQPYTDELRDFYALYYPIVNPTTGQVYLNEADDYIDHDESTILDTYPQLQRTTLRSVSSMVNGYRTDDCIFNNLSHPLLKLQSQISVKPQSHLKVFKLDNKGYIDSLPKSTVDLVLEIDEPSDEKDDDKYMPLAMDLFAFQIQFGIESFIELLLEGNDNAVLQNIITNMDFNTKMILDDDTNYNVMQLTSQNAYKEVGTAIPNRGLFQKFTQQQHFGFVTKANDPFQSPLLQPYTITTAKEIAPTGNDGIDVATMVMNENIHTLFQRKRIAQNTKLKSITVNDETSHIEKLGTTIDYTDDDDYDIMVTQHYKINATKY